jgi:NAD+ kinase
MRLHFQASKAGAAQKALRELTARYGQTKTPRSADCIVALGGDGQTLRALRAGMRYGKPVFGLNFGHTGFLQNLYREHEDLTARIAKAEAIELHPLGAEIRLVNGDIKKTFAINEILICNRNRGQAIYLRVAVDGKERVGRLGGDGLIVATPVGSTGYNRSARGPVLELDEDRIVFTPNNAFLPDRMRAFPMRPRPMTIEVIDPQFRVADVYADSDCVGRKAERIDIALDKTKSYRLLHDPDDTLHERVARMQFSMPGVG